MDELNAALKTCTECRTAKPFKAFGTKLGKLLPRCKECTNRLGRERRASDPERYREQERRRVAAGAYESKLARNRAWYGRNQERNIDRARAYRAANPDAGIGHIARWRARNPDRARELAQVHAAQRRARKKANGPVERLAQDVIGERDGWACGICDRPVDPDLQWPHPQSRVLDHVIPLVRGGTHTSDNVRIAHWLCNARKGGRLDVELPIFNADGTLTCRICSRDQEPAAFYLAAASRTGHRSECRDCWAILKKGRDDSSRGKVRPA
jgi:hypothetical protein